MIIIICSSFFSIHQTQIFIRVIAPRQKYHRNDHFWSTPKGHFDNKEKKKRVSFSEKVVAVIESDPHSRWQVSLR